MNRRVRNGMAAIALTALVIGMGAVPAFAVFQAHGMTFVARDTPRSPC